MKKKIFTGLVAVALLAALAVPAFAAISDAQKTEIDALYSQIAELRKQIVDQYVDAGQITQEQAEAIKKNIDQGTEYQKENSETAGPGFGCGGAAGTGYGMMGGGFGGGMMGGSGMMGNLL